MAFAVIEDTLLGDTVVVVVVVAVAVAAVVEAGNTNAAADYKDHALLGVPSYSDVSFAYHWLVLSTEQPSFVAACQAGGSTAAVVHLAKKIGLSLPSLVVQCYWLQQLKQHFFVDEVL
uniref:Uncharacterized protein n=1 Tax=Parascaris equorum TaxID=6256 RepID=A0A914R6J6_PAREQ